MSKLQYCTRQNITHSSQYNHPYAPCMRPVSPRRPLKFPKLCLPLTMGCLQPHAKPFRGCTSQQQQQAKLGQSRSCNLAHRPAAGQHSTPLQQCRTAATDSNLQLLCCQTSEAMSDEHIPQHCLAVPCYVSVGSPVNHDIEAIGNEPLHSPQVTVNGEPLVPWCWWDVCVAAARLADIRQGHSGGGGCLADSTAVFRVHCALRQLLQSALVIAVP